MTDFTRDDIEKAFIQAGAAKAEALAAGEQLSRFTDLADATGEKEIKNLFGFLREQCFTTRNFLMGETSEQRGTRLLVVACFDLGIFALNDEEMDSDEVTTLEMDVNKVLGVDLEAQLYQQTVDNVMEITGGKERAHAQACGLNITTVTWEDSSRTQGSCWGNNISDMTLAVEVKDTITGKTSSKELPVIRTSNFTDKSADIDPENFNIKVGNESEGELRDITLKEALEKPWELLSDSENWPLKDDDGNNLGLFADGVDKKVLVSAQACLLPVTSKGGEAVYKPHIYQYQSFYDKEHGPQPHVLTMMVTRHGTSVSICGKNESKTTGRGEAIWFNDKGERAPLTSKRPNVTEKLEMELHKAEGRTAQDNADQHNRVLIIQVPLIPEHKPQHSRGMLISTNYGSSYGASFGSMKMASSQVFKSVSSTADSYKGDDSLLEANLTVNGVVVGEEGGGESLESYTLAEINDGAAVTDYMDQERERGGVSDGPRRRRKSAAPRKIAHVRTRGKMDIEDAVINTGETDGEYNEGLSKGWSRDTSSPIRITVQLAKATSNGVVTAEAMADMAQEIEDVYKDASRISSLVVPGSAD